LVSSKEAECNADGSAAAPYRGVDVSYPIHSDKVIPADENPLGDKQTWYDELIGGCRKSCERCDSACVQTESDRIVMNRRQPQSMVNYTDFGIKKIRAPEALMKLLTQFWETNQGLEYPEGKYLWRIAYYLQSFSLISDYLNSFYQSHLMIISYFDFVRSACLEIISRMGNWQHLRQSLGGAVLHAIG
jgi:hypothetical protein